MVVFVYLGWDRGRIWYPSAVNDPDLVLRKWREQIDRTNGIWGKTSKIDMMLLTMLLRVAIALLFIAVLPPGGASQSTMA